VARVHIRGRHANTGAEWFARKQIVTLADGQEEIMVATVDHRQLPGYALENGLVPLKVRVQQNVKGFVGYQFTVAVTGLFSRDFRSRARINCEQRRSSGCTHYHIGP